MANPANLLVIMSDEHSPRFLGCYGHGRVKTPHLDALAERGVRFTNAYCNSPICVPSRASFATGRYAHQTGYWDSAQPYDGRVQSWAHALRETGHHVTSIGKLHYRSGEDDNGFTESLLPLYVNNGVGWPDALQRTDPPAYPLAAEYAQQVGAGWSSYTRYDVDIADRSCQWLEEISNAPPDKPWVLFCSLVSPHYPLIAPREYLDLYPLEEIPLPFAYAPKERPDHQGVTDITSWMNYDDYFVDEDHVRRARQAYFALCSFLDAQIGRILTTLDNTGLTQSTRIIYTSDHGDCLGNHGIWGKSVMYEDSVGIPLIMAGPEVDTTNAVIDTPVSLIDIAPTILDSLNEQHHPISGGFMGRSLFQLLNGSAPTQPVFSEHHDGGSRVGSFMLLWHGRWKYVYHIGQPAQLFDLDNDPNELQDLGKDKDYSDLRTTIHQWLIEHIGDPEQIHRQALTDQAQKLAELGGVDAVRQWEQFNCTPIPS